jgi:putative SOS response-associated peptidase YedK
LFVTASLARTLTEPVAESDHRQGINDREETFTPMRDARVIRLTEAGQRALVSMRWGWPDRWTGMPVDRPRHMHANGSSCGGGGFTRTNKSHPIEPLARTLTEPG